VTETTAFDPGAEAAAATKSILADLEQTAHRGIVVDSPPGAGKSTLVITAALALVAADERCMIAAQTNSQVDDLVERLTSRDAAVRVGRLTAEAYDVPQHLVELPNVTVAKKAVDLLGCDVVVATAAKWASVQDVRFEWAIIDEAYQMRSDMLLLVAPRFSRALFVGDPGQLDPFSIVDTERWVGLPHDPMQSAVAVLLNHNKELPVHRLPVSWRLPPSAAPVIARAFYPFTGFRAGTAPGVRSLSFATKGFGGTVDEALDVAAASGWGLLQLPDRHVPRTDAETAQATADIAARALARGLTSSCENHPGGRTISPEDIAVGVAHRDQAELIRGMLRRSGTAGAERIVVDNANRLQGREFELTVVLHPLSGRRDATEFHLEAGRLCVLTSRHRQACIVVARAGIRELLDNHPSTEPVHLDVDAKFPDGWEANQVVLSKLAQHRVAG
jgi:hypothetical protein